MAAATTKQRLNTEKLYVMFQNVNAMNALRLIISSGLGKVWNDDDDDDDSNTEAQAPHHHHHHHNRFTALFLGPPG